jgi:hypothetical protein
MIHNENFKNVSKSWKPSKMYVYSYDSLCASDTSCKFVIYRFSILGKYYD